MNAKTYNVSLLAGLSLIGTGIGMVSLPAALVTVGVLIIGLALIGVFFGGRKA